MADKFQDINHNDPSVFYKGMVKDIDDAFNRSEGIYTNAINAVNNTQKGDTFTISNEPSNYKCFSPPYTFVGSVYLKDNRHAIFSTDNINSEIGIFDPQDCSYTKVVNDKCLNFNDANLVTGAAKENFDCSETIYWADGRNPDRFLNLSDIPYKKILTPSLTGGCDIETITSELDCDLLRLGRRVKTPCIKLSKGTGGGNLPNGVYRVTIAYTIKEIPVTDYFLISDSEYFFDHKNTGGALQVDISNLEKVEFTEYQLVLVSTSNQQTSAVVFGTYSTSQDRVYIDELRKDSPVVDLSLISFSSPYFERSDLMTSANGSLIRVGITTRPALNYQQQANKIRPKWVSLQGIPNYYSKGGDKIGYQRGETYSFFIRWVYNTGHKSDAFTIPGREATPSDLVIVSNQDAASYQTDETHVYTWQIYDTSTINKVYSSGDILAEGDMGYWESTEEYPNNIAVFGDLACHKIRHSRMPENCTVPLRNSSGPIILGVKFENITPPKVNGQIVSDIVGYEILRGDRTGNKSVIADGLIFNAAEFTLPTSLSTSQKGLYANYPYNDLRLDPFLSGKQVSGGCSTSSSTMGTYRRDYFTIHSPELSFANPTLGNYIKVQTEETGTVKGHFAPVYKHPKNKLISDLALVVAGLVGIGEGMIGILGKTTKSYTSPGAYTPPIFGFANFLPTGASVLASGIGFARAELQEAANQGLGLLDSFLFQNSATYSAEALAELSSTLPGVITHGTQFTKEYTSTDHIPLPLRALNGIALFGFYAQKGADVILGLIQSLLPYKQYAYQYNSHGYYDKSHCVNRGNLVRKIVDYTYLQPYVQDFQGFRINNLQRESSVMIKLDSTLLDPKTQDNTRQTIGNKKLWDDPTQPFTTTASSYYVSVRRKLTSQYGQLESIQIVPTDSCVNFVDLSQSSYTSPNIFGGDCFISRHTVKRKQTYFSQTAAEGGDNPNGFEFDYRQYYNLPYARYWMNSEKYDISDLMNLSHIQLPDDFHHLDRKNCVQGLFNFIVKNAYFYLYNTGIVDFYVSSQYNAEFRDWEDPIEDRFYDERTYTDIDTLFRSDIIKEDNFFKYDFTLSPLKQLNLTFAKVIDRDFDPKVDTTCFVYEPNKLIYSLVDNIESKKDLWQSFLANNYHIFPRKYGRLVTLKAVERTGIIYFFSNYAPLISPGIDQLQTDSGLKVILGDGGLFAREPQRIVDTDYNYGACQSRFGVINTHHGTFFPSQLQGNIYNFNNGFNEISARGLNWWFLLNLPSKLLDIFPNYDRGDNPVTGVGLMSVFDNFNEILYFSKKDYKIKDQYNTSTYIGNNKFDYKGIRFKLGDPNYFEDASFTVSYDVKNNAWVSFHDWHPDWLLQTNDHFLSLKKGSFWKHNDRCDSFCNFYGTDYPWEIEYIVPKSPEVVSLKSIEYNLECYTYSNGCQDKLHILDGNFDRAMLSNSEQHTGLLRLNQRKHNDASSIFNFPRFTASGVDVECVKVEQKYRINQFWDLTRNRGQLISSSVPMWITEANGYRKNINTLYIDYSKTPQERKKLRHFVSKVLLRKTLSGPLKMILLMSITKSMHSFR